MSTQPHFTYYVKVADDGFGQNKFFISGSGEAFWNSDWNISLDYHNDCYGATGMKVYKFDQSDPTNNGHPFYLSYNVDGTHTLQGSVLTGSDGVDYCGTPGTPSGASTKFNTWENVGSKGSSIHTVYPFCPNHSLMGGTSSFYISEISGDECTSGDYECSGGAGDGCSLSSTMTGKLNALISATSSEMGSVYCSHQASSYSYQTGVETGQFHLCSVVGSGTTQANALLRTTELLSLFSSNGKCTNDELGNIADVDVNNVNLSFSSNFNYSNDDIYYSRVSGFSDRRHYVVYQPTITGDKTIVETETLCKNTELEVKLNRDRTAYHTTTYANLLSGSVHQVEVSVTGACGGYETELNITCPRITNGFVKYGKITFPQDQKKGWGNGVNSELFDVGNYELSHVSGSFMTSLGAHTIGSGTITQEVYV